MWRPLPQPDPGRVARLAAAYRLSPIVAALVAQRVPDDAAVARWLAPETASPADPFAFPGMREAVARIGRALAAHEPITVFGDYDVDGVTATALLVQALQRLGAEVKPFFPDRETEGYGLGAAAIARCLTFAPMPALIVTVDCGITNAAEVAELMARGIDVVITDHHTPPAALPPACAVVNPRLGAPSGADGLCGCTTALMLVRALAANGHPLAPDDWLDLAAVATIADVMELRGENRALVARGLRALRAPTANPGLRALAAALKLLPGEPTAEQVAFGIVPCINAAGRLGRLKVAYGLIGLGHVPSAQTLIALNAERRRIERDLFAEVLRLLPPDFAPGRAIVVGGEGFHPGVLGIVAARLVERFGVPVALVATSADGGGHGSMRACGACHAVQALDAVSDLLDHYGGHAKAAGFSLRPGAFEAFRARLPQACPAPDAEEPCACYDADLGDTPISLALCRELGCLEPHGHGNPKPLFAATFTLAEAHPIGADRTHLSLRLTPLAGGNALKAVWFGGACHAEPWKPGIRLRVIFSLGIDTFREPQPQLFVADAFPV